MATPPRGSPSQKKPADWVTPIMEQMNSMLSGVRKLPTTPKQGVSSPMTVFSPARSDPHRTPSQQREEARPGPSTGPVWSEVFEPRTIEVQVHAPPTGETSARRTPQSDWSSAQADKKLGEINNTLDTLTETLQQLTGSMQKMGKDMNKVKDRQDRLEKSGLLKRGPLLADSNIISTEGVTFEPPVKRARQDGYHLDAFFPAKKWSGDPTCTSGVTRTTNDKPSC